MDRVVAEGPGAFSRISVVASTGTQAEVPPGQWGALAPLLAARRLAHPEPLASYGLDRPRARLVYRRRAGGELDVELGGPSFDARLVYARRAGDVGVYLLAADSLRTLLSLAGVALPAPT